ncbi:MAG: ribosomal protein L9 [Parcubacteria bacterium C7867-004]|nr:MAG: ribosomal protein L9 [Parcubacteria bacterium C7867-004]
MKVVLLKDVKNMGRAGSIIECSDGHALNFLMPRRMAAPATATNVKQAEMRAQQTIDRKELDVKLIEERLAALAEEKTVITKKANDKGHLYDAVDAREIAKAANLPVEAISLEKPIKELGEFEIPVAIGESFGKLTIVIAAE